MKNGHDENFATNITFRKNNRKLTVEQVITDQQLRDVVQRKEADGWHVFSVDIVPRITVGAVTMGGLFGTD